MAKAKNKIYLVEHRPGQFKSFSDWPACQAFVSGKSYAFAGGRDREEALKKLEAGKRKLAKSGYASKLKEVRAGNLGKPRKTGPKPPDYPKEGLTSDAGTHGNPGPCEYKVTDIDGKVLEQRKLGVHTNNYAELAGIEAMIRWAVKMGQTQLWTDSKIAMIWIKSAKLGEEVREPEKIMDMIYQIRKSLFENPKLRLRKWETRRWGQIPSDFGRK